MKPKLNNTDKPAVARRTWRVKSKLRLSLFITFVLILIISFASSLLLKGKAMDAPDRYLIWNVSEGDTLWSIAGGNLPKGRDIRDYIYEIKELNQLQTSNIQIGQQLQIPIYSNDGKTDADESEFVIYRKSKP